MATNTNVIAFHDAMYERLLSEISAKDDLAVKLGDALDIKASILLAAITLLATQTAYFLDKHPKGIAHAFLIAAAILLGCATVAAFWELWPRDYHLPVPEKSGIDRLNQLRDFYAPHEDVSTSEMIAEFTRNEIGWAQFRISENGTANKRKSLWLRLSFYFTLAGMTLNIAVLFMRLF